MKAKFKTKSIFKNFQLLSIFSVTRRSRSNAGIDFPDVSLVSEDTNGDGDDNKDDEEDEYDEDDEDDKGSHPLKKTSVLWKTFTNGGGVCSFSYSYSEI